MTPIDNDDFVFLDLPDEPPPTSSWVPTFVLTFGIYWASWVSAEGGGSKKKRPIKVPPPEKPVLPSVDWNTFTFIPPSSEPQTSSPTPLPPVAPPSPPPEEEEVKAPSFTAFDDLASEIQATLIERLITTMYEGGVGVLSLPSIQSDIESVHTLKFLDLIFGNSTLCSYIKKIQEKVYDFVFYKIEPWKRLVDESAKKLTSLKNEESFSFYAHEFATRMGIPASDMQGYVDRNDWEGMINYLVSKKC